MKILLLGPYRDNIVSYLQSFGDDICHSENKLSCKELIKPNYNFIISYGYRYMIPSEVVRYYRNRMINLHISYLPWNRGSDPNFWSFIDNTPKGVTIHYIDEGLDTGDIIIQKRVEFTDKETLSTSYNKLIKTIETLFKENWPLIRDSKNKRYKQIGKGTYHRSKDKEIYFHLLKDGWNTPVEYLINYSRSECFERDQN